MEKVSVIMPCYNDGKYISESIKSVLQQTYEDIELIIIDDGSDDPNTCKIIESLNHKKIVVYRTNRLRPAGARNFGIDRATGKYILPVDADDIIDSTYVEKAVSILDSDENVGIVYCRAELFGEKKGKWDLPDYSLDKMLVNNVIFVTAMFRKQDWHKVGGFNVALEHGMEDYDFWLSIIEQERTVFQLKENLFYYRVKPVSRTSNFNEKIDIVQDTYEKIYYRHRNLYQKHLDCYSIAIRNALLMQISDNRILRKNMWIIDVLNRFSLVKWIIKKIINMVR